METRDVQELTGAWTIAQIAHHWQIGSVERLHYCALDAALHSAISDRHDRVLNQRANAEATRLQD